MLRRGPQWDMFDVASGACSLADYLEQRYAESDLNSTYWIEPTDKLEPIHPPGYVPPPPPLSIEAEEGAQAPPTIEAEGAEAPPTVGAEEGAEPGAGLEDLIARFHQTARQYEEKLHEIEGASDQESGE